VTAPKRNVTWLNVLSWLFLTATIAFAFASRGGEPARPTAAPSPGLVLKGLGSLHRGGVALEPVAEREGPDRTLAPYFVVVGSGGQETEALPLEETRAEVQVAGPIARVRVTQVFRNRGAKPIEALYVFPASTRAAVHGMRLRIGDRTVEARIERKAEARAQYDAARQGGQRAALLEEERQNVFTMRVANVMPGDRLSAELDYSELLVPEEGVYELVYPTVVGPRYVLRQAQDERTGRHDGWAANPTLHQGEAAPYRFGFRAHLESPVPIRDLASPSHAVDVAFASPRTADVVVRGEDGGNRDVVVRWRLSGAEVESGALLYPDGEGGGWFLATLQPPRRVALEAIPPREYIFVLDVSGSMNGFPLDTAKALMADLLPKLRPVDHFNVVFFSGGSRVLSPGGSLAATPENVRAALATFDRMSGGGGTELLQALTTAYALPRPDRRVARSVVVVTDGYVTVEPEAFRLVRERLAEASCFSFGIGTSVNRALIEGLARAGQGEATVVLSPDHARAAADRLERIIAAPVLTQLHARFEGLDATDVLPGALPDLLAERPVTLLGRYRGAPRGKLVLEAQSAQGPFRRELDLGAATPRAENAPLRVLWARRWVELLLDEHHLGPAPEIEEAIASLGIAHHLLTPFTSFVAVDSEVVNEGGHADGVTQPLPLPEGVSDLAVGPKKDKARGGLGKASAPEAKGLLAQPVTTARPAAPPPPSTPPAPHLRLDRAVEKEEAVDAVQAEPGQSPRRDAGAAGTKPDSAAVKGPAPAVQVLRERAKDVEAEAQLQAAVLEALRKLSLEGVRGEVELRLTLDAQGGIARVELFRAPRAFRARIEAALRAVHSAARPRSGAASYTLTARLG